MDAADVIRAFDLAPLPDEGGHFRETYRSAHSTAILYLLDAASCSLFHRLAHDEVWHFHAGDPVELWLLRPDGAGERLVLGADLAAGHAPQAICPAGTWEGARLAAGGRFALMGCTVAPPFRPGCYETARRADLLAAYPAFAAEVAALTGEEGP
ncbi:MAG: cupin domain-containing protein [Deltaproteobacteria bacterium]|nr:cupin domain-containing protein [Deltaproteobacteria bacterium]